MIAIIDYGVGNLFSLKSSLKEIGAEAAGISMGISNICIALASIICLVIFMLKLSKNKKAAAVLQPSDV